MRFSIKSLDRLTAKQRDPNDRCRDFDEDCDEVACKLACWLHDPEQGICPYLTGEMK